MPFTRRLFVVVLISWAIVTAGRATANTILNYMPETGGWGFFGPGYINQVGETITVPLADDVLESFSFKILIAASPFQFKGEVAAWDGTKAVGPLLYESAEQTASSSTIYTFTPNIQLSPGGTYVLFLGAVLGSGATGPLSSLGARDINSYSGGMLVYNGAPTANDPWTSISNGNLSDDLAFTASFTTQASAASTPLPSAAWAGSALMSGLGLTRYLRRAHTGTLGSLR